MDAESLALLINHHLQQVCACRHIGMCLACVCVIMAKLIDHQHVPICLVNTAQNHKQEEWDVKAKGVNK